VHKLCQNGALKSQIPTVYKVLNVCFTKLYGNPNPKYKIAASWGIGCDEGGNGVDLGT
jgi:hypothetical protein